jgi:NAD(P)-dependent dehydrogenase (short-subunit alcohol dehydrogenase family)
MACPFSKTKDGFETQFGVNHLAHFVLFQLVKPALLSSSSPAFHSRVVTVSSSGHQICPPRLHDPNFDIKDSYHPMLAYGQSKTANVWMATEIERRFGAQGLHANSAMPGGMWTGLQRHLDDVSLSIWKSAAIEPLMKSTEQGAATSVWAAVAAELEGNGGKYLEDCAVAAPKDMESKAIFVPGHVPHAYDAEGAKKLWKLSLRMVGLPEEQ